jgi:hypothetical protein
VDKKTGKTKRQATWIYDCLQQAKSPEHLRTLRSKTFQGIADAIAEKVRGLNRNGWDQNTNLQAVFDLILRTAVKNKLSEDHMPDSIYIISDMAVDIGNSSNNMTNYEIIRQKYKTAGYKLPRLVWWNVNATGTDSPVTVNDQGTCLVSGCSPSILKSVLSAKVFTPTDVMLETINNPRYDVIKV